MERKTQPSILYRTTEDKRLQIKQLAEAKGVSVNSLIDTAVENLLKTSETETVDYLANRAAHWNNVLYSSPVISSSVNSGNLSSGMSMWVDSVNSNPYKDAVNKLSGTTSQEETKDDSNS
jgi:hypothetical protein